MSALERKERKGKEGEGREEKEKEGQWKGSNIVYKGKNEWERNRDESWPFQAFQLWKDWYINKNHQFNPFK